MTFGHLLQHAVKIIAFCISPRTDRKEIAREEKSNEIVTGKKW